MNIYADWLRQTPKILWQKSPLDQLQEDPAAFARLQHEDPFLKLIFQYLENGSMPQSSLHFNTVKEITPHCQIEDGILWLKRLSGYVLLLPTKSHNLALSIAHDSRIGGHRNHLMTQERLQTAFWWPFMSWDIQNYIKNCHLCQIKNNPHSKASTTAPLHPLQIPQRFNDRVSMDLMGPLHSDDGYKYILLITDVFSKWAKLIPIHDKEAKTVAEEFFWTWIAAIPFLERSFPTMEKNSTTSSRNSLKSSKYTTSRPAHTIHKPTPPANV